MVSRFWPGVSHLGTHRRPRSRRPAVEVTTLLLAYATANAFVTAGTPDPKHPRPAYLACSYAGVGSPSLTKKASAACLSMGQYQSLMELGGVQPRNKKKASRSFSTGSINSFSPLGMKRSSSAYLRVQIPDLSAVPSSDMYSNNDSADHIDGRTEFIAECKLPTEKGTFRLRSYRYKGAKLVVRNGERVLEWIEMEPVVVIHGDLEGKRNVVVRVHDQCFTSEVLGSKRCDCREQLDMALVHISQTEGAVIYMPQEGRGIGLANKIAAYELQDSGLDTVDANRHLGFDDDERSYSCVPFILQDIGVQSVQLITNNPYKIRHLRDSGVNIDSVRPSIVVPNMHNEKYLRTKAERMAHILSLDKLRVPSTKPAAALGPQSVPAAIETLREGGIIMLVRGEGIEAEAALVVMASKANTDTVSAMSKVTEGFVVAVLRPERWEQLHLGDAKGKTMSIDFVGMDAIAMSSGGRAGTLRALADHSIGSDQFRRPGHMFARVNEGGFGTLNGGALELVRLAGGDVVGVCELVNADGVGCLSMGEAMQIAESLSVPVTSVNDVKLHSA